MGIGPTAPTVYPPSPHTAPLITGAGRTYLLSPLLCPLHVDLFSTTLSSSTKLPSPVCMWRTGQCPKVERASICGESEPMLHSLTTSDWSLGRIHIQMTGSFRLSWAMKLAGDRGWCSWWIQGQEGKAWGQKGDLGLAGPTQLSHSCFHPLALWHRPSPLPQPDMQPLPAQWERPHVQPGQGQDA